MTVRTEPLVGRERELALLEQMLGETLAGNPQFVFVSGEPGIGKTSLIASLLRLASDQGFLTLSGSAAKAGASVNDITDPSVVDRLTGNAAFNAVPVSVVVADRELEPAGAAGRARFS